MTSLFQKVYDFFIEEISDETIQNTKEDSAGLETLPDNLEELLLYGQMSNHWQGLPFFPKLTIHYGSKNLLYLVGREKPLSERPVKGFRILEEESNGTVRYSIYPDYC